MIRLSALASAGAIFAASIESKAIAAGLMQRRRKIAVFRQLSGERLAALEWLGERHHSWRDEGSPSDAAYPSVPGCA